MTDSENRPWTHWFEIPVSDFDCAAIVKDEKLLKNLFEIQDFGPFKMGIFPHSKVGGAICFGEHYSPGPEGVVIYLDASPDLNDVVERIEKTGGQILQAKKQISEDHGFMALFQDSEGNRVALHSMN